MSYLDDLMYDVLAAHYGGTKATVALSDLRSKFVQDYPEYLTNRRARFYRDHLDALKVDYSPSAHLADLARLFWQNFDFSGVGTINELLLEDGTDFLLENGTLAILEVGTGVPDDLVLEDGTDFLLEDGSTLLEMEL